MRVIETAHPINALKIKKIWRSTQCWQRGLLAKQLGRRNTVSGVGTHLLRQKGRFDSVSFIEVWREES